MLFFSQQYLESLPRAELQRLAKKHNVKANAKTVVLIQKLIELDRHRRETSSPEPEEEVKEEPAGTDTVDKVDEDKEVKTSDEEDNKDETVSRYCFRRPSR